MKKILIILITGSLLFANSAFAGRFGGGRSSGMQRSSRSASPSYNSNSGNYGHSQQGSQQQAPSAGQRPGMGAGTAAMLGAAAGAAGGYMLGKSNSNENNGANTANASGAVAAKATEEAKSSIPWGTIAILVALLVLGLIFFRKKINPGLSSGNPMNNFTSNGNNNGFNMPNINRTPNNAQSSKPIIRFGSAANTAPEPIDKLPDGLETVYFLRQAKGMFLHIQSMNSSDNLSEIQKYMTAQLFEETKDDIVKNQTLADFTNLDCQLIQCDSVEASQTEDGVAVEPHLVASVKFSGNVSDSPEQAPVPFSETWNFVKSESTNNKWIVAGIQQETIKA